MQPTTQLLLTRLGAAALALATLTLAEPDAAGQVLPGPISLTPTTAPKATVTIDPVSGAGITIPASSLDQTISPVGAARTLVPAKRPIPASIYHADRLLSDGTSLWVLDRKRNHVVRLDPQTGMALTVIAPPVPAGVCQIADFLLEGSEMIWIGCGSTVYRMQIATRTVERAVNVPVEAFRMAFVRDKLVILCHDTQMFAARLVVYSPSTGVLAHMGLYRWDITPTLIESSTVLTDDYGNAIDLEVVGADNVIVTQSSGLSLLFRITQAPQLVATLLHHKSPGWVDTAFLDGVLWTLNGQTGQLHRTVLGSTQTLSSLQVGAGARKLLHTGRILWVMLPDRLVAVNPFTNTKMGEAAVGVALSDFTFSGAEVIGLDQGGLLRRLWF